MYSIVFVKYFFSNYTLTIGPVTLPVALWAQLKVKGSNFWWQPATVTTSLHFTFYWILPIVDRDGQCHIF